MTTIWLDGSLRPIDEARPSILAHTLHYGVGVFEGIRSYRADGGALGSGGPGSITKALQGALFELLRDRRPTAGWPTGFAAAVRS